MLMFFCAACGGNVVEILLLVTHDYFQVSSVCPDFGIRPTTLSGKAGRKIKNSGVSDIGGNRGLPR